MDWTCILAPLSGGAADSRALSVARALAAPFSATLSAAYTSTPSSELVSWAGEAGLNPTAQVLCELQEASRVARGQGPHRPGQDRLRVQGLRERHLRRLAEAAGRHPPSRRRMAEPGRTRPRLLAGSVQQSRLEFGPRSFWRGALHLRSPPDGTAAARMRRPLVSRLEAKGIDVRLALCRNAWRRVHRGRLCDPDKRIELP